MGEDLRAVGVGFRVMPEVHSRRGVRTLANVRLLPHPSVPDVDLVVEPFEYLSVLISIIVGLGLSHILHLAARLIQKRSAVRPFGPVFVWLGVLFVLQVQMWWAAFYWQREAPWTFFTFLLFLTLPIGAYLASVLLVPDLDAADRVDLRRSYFANRRWFFGIVAALPVLSVLHERIHSGTVPVDVDLAFRVGFFVVALVGFAVRRRVVHWGLAITFGVAFAAYVVLLFLRLP